MSEDEARHTPTPWRVTRRHYKSLPHLVGHNGRYVMNAAPRGTYHRSEVLQVADAEHIVRCVNAHDELVAALRSLSKFVERIENKLGMHCAINAGKATCMEGIEDQGELIDDLLRDFDSAPLKAARAALAKAAS